MWLLVVVCALFAGGLSTPVGVARLAPMWLGLLPVPSSTACDTPILAWAALARGELRAADTWACRSDIVGGERRRAVLDARLADRHIDVATRREIARLLLATGDGATLLADARLGVDLRRGLVDVDTIAHADDDLVALSQAYPLGGAWDAALVAEALSAGDATITTPLAGGGVGMGPAGLLAGLPRVPASTPSSPQPSSYLAEYAPIGEAFAEHVFEEWAAVRGWVAAGRTERDRADRVMAVLVADSPGEPWVSVHALVRGERVTPALVVAAALDLGESASLPVSARGDAEAVVIGVGHRAVYAPACGPRRPAALPGTRVDPDWGSTPVEIARRARVLSDTWGLGPCSPGTASPD